jgi:hypothetical protein
MPKGKEESKLYFNPFEQTIVKDVNGVNFERMQFNTNVSDHILF